MKVIINVTKSFKKEAKPLLKKFKSLSSDLLNLHKQLEQNPRLGTALGANAYKIRLKINSKTKGKSGGARAISLIEAELIGTVQLMEETTIVNLIYIFDKSDTDNIPDKQLKDLIKQFKKDTE